MGGGTPISTAERTRNTSSRPRERLSTAEFWRVRARVVRYERAPIRAFGCQEVASQRGFPAAISDAAQVLLRYGGHARGRDVALPSAAERGRIRGLLSSGQYRRPCSDARRGYRDFPETAPGIHQDGPERATKVTERLRGRATFPPRLRSTLRRSSSVGPRARRHSPGS